MTERRSSSIVLAIRANMARVALVASCTLAGCVTVGRLSEREAVIYARNDVCGASAADSVCVVRSVERTDQGYRIVIDRRPPYGQDRLSIDVRGGMFVDPHIKVTPVDTATRRP
jgi:hypothetical protein